MCNLKAAPHLLNKVGRLVSGAISLFAVLTVIASTTVVSGIGLVDKDTEMQAIFFLDKFGITQTIDMHHRFFQPERVDGFIALDTTGRGTMAYFNVYFDPDRQLYRAWYKMGGGGSAVCYAESRDGINWDNPELPEDTDPVTPIRKNAVFSGTANLKHGVVTYDPYDPDSSRRYKLPYEENKETMQIAYSPDGIKWRIDRGPTWHPGVRADTENNIFYNPFTERWQVITRASSVDRRIAMIETEDLKTWSKPRVIIHPSPDDPVGMEFYGMPTSLYEDIFLGLLWKFQTGTTNKGSPRRNDGIIEPELAYSYDGVTWNRTHRTLIDRGSRGAYSGARIYPESIVINHEGNINIYSRTYVAEHGSDSEDIGKVEVVLHRMRRDGFAGMESIGIEGYLKTKVFILKDGELTLNVSAPYGSVNVQISDKSSNPYPGYSFDDCMEWTGDEIFHQPQWKNKEDLSELVGKEVRFEIKMKEGILYAIRASLNPSNVIPPMKRY